MRRPDVPDELSSLALGIFVLLAPVLFLTVTLTFLLFTGDLLLSGLTIVEILELYIIDLLLFVALAYGLYRLILGAGEKLPEQKGPRDRSRKEEERTREDSFDDRR